MCVHILDMWDNMKNLFDLKAVSSVSIPKYIDLEQRISLLILKHVNAKNTLRIALASPGATINEFYMLYEYSLYEDIGAAITKPLQC